MSRDARAMSIDRRPRLLVALYWGIALGLLLVVVGVTLVLQAYVPPEDIASTTGPIPFFETIEPVPFFTAVLGALLTIASLAGVLVGRSRRLW